MSGVTDESAYSFADEEEEGVRGEKRKRDPEDDGEEDDEED